MAGIIQTQLTTPEADTYNNFVGYDAEKIALDPNSLVQNQVANITKADGPLMQLASTRGTQTANRRGLINSSMAVGAAQKEVLSAALPIAQQDASTTFDLQKTNTAAENRAREVTVDSTNKAADLWGRTKAEEALSRQNYLQDTELQKLRGSQQKELDQIAQQNQRLVTASQNAAIVMAEAQQGINAILANENWSPEVKQSMIDKLNMSMDRQLATISAFSDVDVSSLLSFGGAPAGGGTPPPGNAPPPSDPTSAAAINQAFTQMQSTAKTEREAVQTMFNYMASAGATIDQMAAGTGWSASDINSLLAKYGMMYP